VEINSSGRRLDLKDGHARRAGELGVSVAVDSDAHDAPDLGAVALGVGIARRAWLGPAQVVNALPLDRFLEWARRGKRRPAV
jgi:DNA polymerase (family 10)